MWRNGLLDLLTVPKKRMQLLFTLTSNFSCRSVEFTNYRSVAQGYDGAVVISGSENGVQSMIRKDHPSAFYIHCMAHKLNLVLVEACKVNRMVNSFFLTLETIYCFFLHSLEP